MTARIMPLLRWSWIVLVTGLCLWPMPAVIADEQWGQLGYLIVTPLLTLCCFAKSPPPLATALPRPAGGDLEHLAADSLHPFAGLLQFQR